MRTTARPPPIARWPQRVPESRGNGASPARAAICRRPRRPTARPLAALGLAPDHTLARFTTRGVVREAAGGAYYLDEAALIAHRDRATPSRRALLVIALLLMAGSVALVAGMRLRR